MNRSTMWARRLLGMVLLLACTGLLMGADRRIGRVPAATGELTLLSGDSGSFDVMAANDGLAGFELRSVNRGSLGSASIADGVIHYSAHAGASGVDRVGYQLVTGSGQLRLGELRVRVVDAQAQVALRVNLVVAERSGVRVELRQGDEVVSAGVTRGDGVVDLTVPAGWPGDAMLELHAEGMSAGPFPTRLVWVSGLGSVRQLRTAAAGGPLDALKWPALRLGAASTAFQATLLDIDPGAATDEAAAMRAALGVDPERMMTGAAVVDLIESGARWLPGQFDDTWQLLSDPVRVGWLSNLWRQDVYDAILARSSDPAATARIPAGPYNVWFVPPSANDLLLGSGEGMTLAANGTGNYFAQIDRDDTGLEWTIVNGAPRVILNEQFAPGYSVQGRTCTLANGASHSYMVELVSRRDTVDLVRLYGFGGLDYIARRWHVVVSESLYAPVPEDCDADVRQDYTLFGVDFATTRPNPDTISVAGPPVPVPSSLVLALDDRSGRLVTGLLDVEQGTLALEGFEPGIEVHLARAGVIRFDAFSDADGDRVRFELQRVHPGLEGSGFWSVVRHGSGEAPRGWVTAAVEPGSLGGEFEWNGLWTTQATWAKTGTLGNWRNEERWDLDVESERAMPYRKPLLGSGWTPMVDDEQHFLIEEGAAVLRRYQGPFGSTRLTCPSPPEPCWRHSERRLLPLAEIPDAFGPGYHLVFLMHEYGRMESAEGWAVYERFVDAWIREPGTGLQRPVLLRAAGRDARR